MAGKRVPSRAWPAPTESRGFRERLDNPRPGSCQVVAVVAAPAGGDDASFAVLIRQNAQSRGGFGVCFLGKAQMGDWITLEAVRAALENNELRLVMLEIRLDGVPGFVEVAVACAWLTARIGPAVPTTLSSWS